MNGLYYQHGRHVDKILFIDHLPGRVRTAGGGFRGGSTLQFTEIAFLLIDLSG